MGRPRLARTLMGASILALSAACSSGGSATVDAGAGATRLGAPIDAGRGGRLDFAAPCQANDQCMSGLCFSFGDGTMACTITCTTSDQCPAGSQGKKCNNKGVCRT